MICRDEMGFFLCVLYKEKMGCWDVFCPLCGIPLIDVVERIKEYNYLKKPVKIPRSNWSDKCTILLPGKKAKHGFQEINCNITFYNKKTNEEYDVDVALYGDSMPGIVLHTDCWKTAKNMNHTLSFDDFNLKKTKQNTYIWNHYMFTYLNYKEVSKYHRQDFDLELLCKNPKNLYLLYSPLLSNKSSIQNKKRIVKNINKLFKNKPKYRPSPSQSATVFKQDFKMAGNDGNMYIVDVTTKNIKRWVLVKSGR
jgi:hypothetical protein